MGGSIDSRVYSKPRTPSISRQSEKNRGQVKGQGFIGFVGFIGLKGQGSRVPGAQGSSERAKVRGLSLDVER